VQSISFFLAFTQQQAYVEEHADREPKSMALPSHPPRASVPSVLLVDDDPDTLQLYSAFLRFSGLHVWTAGSAPAALSSAREHHPDVVVTDISLPGEDGWTLCRLLRANIQTRECGVIALTGWVHDTHLAARAEEAGVDLVLTKPCLPDALLGNIQKVRRRGLLLRVRGQRAIARAATLRTRSDRLARKSADIQRRVKRRRKG
jgi:two-component system response regulator MprA